MKTLKHFLPDGIGSAKKSSLTKDHIYWIWSVKIVLNPISYLATFKALYK